MTPLASAAGDRYFISMEMVTFDTHDFVKRLTGAGMPEPQAEILAGEQSRLIRERLATKRDIEALDAAREGDKNELKRDIKELEAAIKELEVAIRELDEARERDKNELDAARERDKNELKRDIKELELAHKRDMKELQQQLTIKMGGIIFIGFGAMSAVIKLL